MKRQKSQQLLTQFGFKQQRKEIAGKKHFLKCKLFSVRRVPVYNPPVDQKISFGACYE